MRSPARNPPGGWRNRRSPYGVDAPEGQQPCDGEAGARYFSDSRAAEALASIIGRSGRVTCQEEDRDRYGRIVAVCTAGGVGINGELVRQGWALEYREYSDGRSIDEEDEARQAERGLWAGEFVPPWNGAAAPEDLAGAGVGQFERHRDGAVGALDDPGQNIARRETATENISRL